MKKYATLSIPAMASKSKKYIIFELFDVFKGEKDDKKKQEWIKYAINNLIDYDKFTQSARLFLPNYPSTIISNILKNEIIFKFGKYQFSQIKLIYAGRSKDYLKTNRIDEEGVYYCPENIRNDSSIITKEDVEALNEEKYATLMYDTISNIFFASSLYYYIDNIYLSRNDIININLQQLFENSIYPMTFFNIPFIILKCINPEEIDIKLLLKETPFESLIEREGTDVSIENFFIPLYSDIVRHHYIWLT